MNLNDAKADYEHQVSDILSIHSTNFQKKSKNLHRLTLLIVEKTCTKSNYKEEQKLFKWFQKVLKTEFMDAAKRSAEKKSDKETPWEEFVVRQLDYNARFNKLRQHIHYIDSHPRNGRKGVLLPYLEYLFLYYVLEEQGTLLDTYKKVCEHFIHVSKDCQQDLICIHDSIYCYEMFHIETKGYERSDRMDRFFDIGVTCLEEWANRTLDISFFNAYKIWQNTLELLNLTGDRYPRLSGLKTLFNEDPHLLLESLKNVILTPNTLDTICNSGDAPHWIILLKDAFLKWRSVEFTNYDFEQLLASIVLSDSFGDEEDSSKHGSYQSSLILNELRQNFLDSVKNVPEFHTKLLNYLDLTFKKNYDALRKAPDKGLSSEQELWIAAMVSLLLHYLPDREIFFKRYLKQGLFQQIMMLNSKFPAFHNHQACLQRILINKLHSLIPRDTYHICGLLKASLDTLQDTTLMNHDETEFTKLYIPKEIASELSLKLEEDLETFWPSIYFQNEWEKQVAMYNVHDKTLHGLFSMHILTITTPVCLANGKNLTLLVNICMASIIYLFNDSAVLSLAQIRTNLNSTGKGALMINLDKLLRYNIILETKKGHYTFNVEYKPSSMTLRTGILRIL